MFMLILAVLCGFGSSEGTSCPSFITCETSETPDSCPDNTFYREHVKVHGCCPGCVALKGENEPCSDPSECQPGLTCSSTCVKDPTQACEYYKRFDRIFQKTKYWKPVCLPDGTYAPKQCKGEKMTGKCFCVNKMGERIFGEEDWSKAENMTCGVGRLMENLKQRGIEASFRSDVWGNFEPLQCNEKVCWCANPTTGIPYSMMVPVEMMIGLPCYHRDAVGAQYYRQCDSMSHMQNYIMSLLRNHGTTGITLQMQKCNLDGSYHRVQILREKKQCVYVNNSPLSEAIESKDANCNCVYDKHAAQLAQKNFLLECSFNGNYKSKQICNEKPFCIDNDGFYYSDDPDDCFLSPSLIRNDTKN